MVQVAPGWPQDVPKVAPGCPRYSQGGPVIAEGGPKTAPGGPTCPSDGPPKNNEKALVFVSFSWFRGPAGTRDGTRMLQDGAKMP